MAAEAIPGLAVPLLSDGCRETAVDADWLMASLRLRSPGPTPLDLTALRRRTAAWFSPATLAELIPGESDTEVMARDWLAVAGKRWRPFLALAAWHAVVGDVAASDDGVIRYLAVAVECFHKASLIHDDIEDDDDFRYGAETLHRRHGVPVALNLGDLLIGEGYRLIAASGADPERIARMLAAAAEGHRRLCLGQGEEMLCLKRAEPPSPSRVIDIFRHKTAPAFAVALQLGAIAAGVDEETDDVLAPFSDALGVAYQIHDDFEDLLEASADASAHVLRPSLLLALAWEQAAPAQRDHLLRFWRKGGAAADLRSAFHDPLVMDKARQLADHYKNEAVRALNPVRHAVLKTLLRRVIVRILDRGPVS
jgi:geranylgeranyl pyrophosphate synthase